MHIKKSKMPKSWPIERKGTKFIAVPSHSYSNGISLLFLLRNVLKIARTRKEVRKMTLNGMVKINNKVRKDENFPVQVFDNLNLEKAKLNYRLEIVNKKFSLRKVSSKEAETKIVKIVGKTILKNKAIQMNLSDGQNILTKLNFSVGDSAIINNSKRNLEKILPLKKGSKIEVIGGKHAGSKGELVEFEELKRGKNYIIKIGKREVSLPFKTVLVIG